MTAHATRAAADEAERAILLTRQLSRPTPCHYIDDAPVAFLQHVHADVSMVFTENSHRAEVMTDYYY